MAIAHIQSKGAKWQGTDVFSLAFDSAVQTGDILVIGLEFWGNSATRVPVVGDFGYTGTATLGTPTLDITVQSQYTAQVFVAIYSVPVVSGGSCTISISNAPSGSYGTLGISEFSGVDVTSSRVVDTSVYSAVTNTTTPSTGDMTSPGAALFFGGNESSTGEVLSYITADSPFVNIITTLDGYNDQVGAIAYGIMSGGTTDSVSWVSSVNTDFCCVGVAYKSASPPYYDSFPIDEDPMGASYPNWTNGQGGFDPCKVASGKFGAVTKETSAGAVYTGGTFSNDQYAQVVIAALNTSAIGGGPNLNVRMQTGTADGYGVYYDLGPKEWVFFKAIDDGADSTTLGSHVSASLAVNDIVKLVCTGGATATLELFVNSVSVGSRTDSSSPYTSGKPGLSIYDLTLGDSLLDNFEAGQAESGVTAINCTISESISASDGISGLFNYRAIMGDDLLV